VKHGSLYVCSKRTINIIIIFALLLVLFGAGCNSVSPKLQDEYIRPGLSQEMHSVFDKYRQLIPRAMSEDKLPGLSLALVDRDGILWTAGFGYTDYNRETPVTPDTIFSIGSISKMITAVAAMVAVQDGLLELDVPIIEYFPQFTVNSRFEDKPHKKITLSHLLNHTSGIARFAPVGNIREPSHGSLEDKVLSISSTWLRCKVGERYGYSNFGYDLIAYVIQIQSGQPFTEYVEDKVFSPLNMPSCSLDAEFIENHPNRAIGHMSHVKRIPLTPDIPLLGCGGVYASAKEMARFVQLFLNEGKIDGQTFLDDSIITNMQTPSIRNKDYGLGVEIYRDRYLYLGHGGFGLGFISTTYWLGEYGIGAVCLVNSENCTHSFDILDDLIKQKLVQKTESFEIPSVEYQPGQPLDLNTFTPFRPAWKKYIGTYEFYMSGWEQSILLRIALGLGITTNYTHLRVFEKDGYLNVDSKVFHDDDGGRLDENQPGLFFTPTGKCLDLRGPKLTWVNFRIKKVE
jgi:CubicO group peptidase (beta-lactamase class C family)